MSLAQIIQAVLTAICSAFALPIAEDAIEGKLDTPTVIHDAIPTPQVDAVVGNALVSDFLPK